MRQIQKNFCFKNFFARKIRFRPSSSPSSFFGLKNQSRSISTLNQETSGETSNFSQETPLALIIGGSYGGLSLALFLNNIGIKSVIFTDDSLSYQNNVAASQKNSLKILKNKKDHYIGLWSNCLRCLRAINIDLIPASLRKMENNPHMSIPRRHSPPLYSYMMKSGYLSQKGSLLASPKTSLKEGDLLFMRERDILMSLLDHCNTFSNINICKNTKVVCIQHGVNKISTIPTRVKKVDERQTTVETKIKSKPLGKINEIPDDRVAVLCEDGTRYSGDFIIGADGMFSNVRNLLTSKSIVPTRRGYFVYRGLSIVKKSDIDDINFFNKFSFQSWGYQQRFAAVQLHKDEENVEGDHGQLHYMWFATIANYPGSVYDNDGEKQQILNLLDINTSDEKLKEHLLRYFPSKSWHNPIQEILKNAYNVTAEDAFSIAQRDTLGVGFHSTSNMTLIGDAAHGLDPILAQGAGVAIEDAYILSKALEKTFSMEKRSEKAKEGTNIFDNKTEWKNKLTEAFRMYEKDRYERIRLLNMISNISQYLGAHHSASFSFVRDLFFILSPNAIKGQIFDFFIKLSLTKSIWTTYQPFAVEKVNHQGNSFK